MSTRSECLKWAISVHTGPCWVLSLNNQKTLDYEIHQRLLKDVEAAKGEEILEGYYCPECGSDTCDEGCTSYFWFNFNGTWTMAEAEEAAELRTEFDKQLGDEFIY